MKINRCAIITALAMATLAPAAVANGPQPLPAIKIVDYNKFSVARVLEENVGKQIEVTIATGATFKGKLAGVGAQAIHLSELTGKEFYDAAIEKSAIVAVVLRVRDH
jgi:hypothetical protein